MVPGPACCPGALESLQLPRGVSSGLPVWTLTSDPGVVGDPHDAVGVVGRRGHFARTAGSVPATEGWRAEDDTKVSIPCGAHSGLGELPSTHTHLLIQALPCSQLPTPIAYLENEDLGTALSSPHPQIHAGGKALASSLKDSSPAHAP